MRTTVTYSWLLKCLFPKGGSSLVTMSYCPEGNSSLPRRRDTLFTLVLKNDRSFYLSIYLRVCVYYSHYKENTKKWLGLMTKIGSKMHWSLASFPVLNLIMSDYSLQTKWLRSYRTIFVPYRAVLMGFWDIVLDRPSTPRPFSLYLVTCVWLYIVICSFVIWLEVVIIT